jgi:hypothetical protein
VPHAVILGSRIATTNRLPSENFALSTKKPEANDSSTTLNQVAALDSDSIELKGNRSLTFIQKHIKRASIDIAFSLSKFGSVRFCAN